MTIKQLVDIAQRRLVRGNHGIPNGQRRLFPVTPATQKKLAAVSKRITREVGFVVHPMQVAALLVEDVIGAME